MSPSDTIWLLRLAQATAIPDPSDGFAAALGLLAELGISTQPSDAAAEPFLEFEDGLALYCASDPPDVPLGQAIDSLMTGLRLRARDRERLQMLSSASFEGLFAHIDGEIVDANDQIVSMTGYPREEVLGQGLIFKVVDPDDLPRVMEHMAKGYEGAYTITAIRKDGSRFAAELQTKQGHLGKRPVRMVAVRDVTERERQTQLLRENEARLRALAERAFDYFILSADGKVIDVGGEYERILGFKREELVGRGVTELVVPDARDRVADAIRNMRPMRHEVETLTKSGEYIPVEVVAIPSSHEGKHVRMAGIRDLREVRRLEEERRAMAVRAERGQRMEALGVLAGGIAHDFNNLLMGILGHAELLSMRLDEPDDLASLEAIRNAGERAASLTRQMLTYAGRRRSAEREALDLEHLLHELARLLQSTLSEKAQLRIQVPPGCAVIGDRTGLSQVLMNLLGNASDALAGKPGRIDISARTVTEPDASWHDSLGAQVGPGHWVQLDVRDSGIGMDSDTRARIFEPFFSTKSKGHGLGLAASVGIIKAHAGAIRVESEPGRGSCFSLLLPATRTQLRATPSSEPIPVVRPCHVLIVDDEHLVRRQLRQHLEREGFRVDEADHAALGIALHAQVTPDVIIMDLSMPEMDGIEAATHIREGGGTTPIILASGYLTLDVEARIPAGMVQAFLHKPFSHAELIRAIAKCR